MLHDCLVTPGQRSETDENRDATHNDEPCSAAPNTCPTPSQLHLLPPPQQAGRKKHTKVTASKTKPCARRLSGVTSGLLAFSGYTVLDTEDERRRQLARFTEESREIRERLRVQSEKIETQKTEERREQNRMRKARQRVRDRLLEIQNGERDASGHKVSSESNL